MGSVTRAVGAWSTLALTGLLATGCAGLGMEDVLGGIGRGGDVRGQIDWVDERSREIGVSNSWGNRETVRYDSRTRVVYRERRYEVRDLERGDVVSIDVDEDSRDRRYARTVRVERSVRDGDGRVDGGRLERFDGRVVWVDLDRGQFGLEAGRGGSYVVTVPYRSRDSTLSRFRRLRRGDRVRFDGESYSRGRIELERFV